VVVWIKLYLETDTEQTIRTPTNFHHSRTTVTGAKSNDLQYGDNDSEEYIMQNSSTHSEPDRSMEHSASSGPIKGYGNITKTVEFGYAEGKKL
jgi:hypothetical protein